MGLFVLLQNVFERFGGFRCRHERPISWHIWRGEGKGVVGLWNCAVGRSSSVVGQNPMLRYHGALRRKALITKDTKNHEVNLVARMATICEQANDQRPLTSLEHRHQVVLLLV